MIEQLTIAGFRGLKSLSITGLGTVNLFVGTNSSGKTSILEAVHALSCGDVRALLAALERRAEMAAERPDEQPRRARLDARGLFHGFTAAVGAKAVIRSRDASMNVEVVKDVSGWDSRARPAFCYLTTEYQRTTGDGGIHAHQGLHPDGAFIPDEVFTAIGLDDLLFLGSGSLSRAKVVSLFSPIVLTAHEDSVVEAMRIVEPGIERIALVGPGAGIAVKLRGVGERVPIGSLGEGAWRMLGLVLALVRTQGVLLVDDIDTGLHHSVMPKMWELVKTTAQRLGVQVFATTHSRDCVEALSAISRDDVAAGSAVTIHRVERGRPTTIDYTEQEIVAAAERGIEVR